MKAIIETQELEWLQRNKNRKYTLKLESDKGSIISEIKDLTIGEVRKIKDDLTDELSKIESENYTPRNDVASFVYYMNNYWKKEECEECFKNNPVCSVDHLWNKYCKICDEYGVWAAPMRFFCELDETLQDILTQRAITVYNRRTRLC